MFTIQGQFLPDSVDGKTMFTFIGLQENCYILSPFSVDVCKLFLIRHSGDMGELCAPKICT